MSRHNAAAWSVQEVQVATQLSQVVASTNTLQQALLYRGLNVTDTQLLYSSGETGQFAFGPERSSRAPQAVAWCICSGAGSDRQLSCANLEWPCTSCEVHLQGYIERSGSDISWAEAQRVCGCRHGSAVI